MGETTAVDVDDLEPGDKVLWGDRKEPLEVQESNVNVSGAVDEGDISTRKVQSKRGTVYALIDDRFGDLKVKRSVPVSDRHPSGLAPHEYAEDLRKVVEEDSEDEEGGIGEYSVEIGVTGTWRETTVATSAEKAEEVAEEQLRSRIGVEDGEWGDIGFEVIGSRRVDADE